MFGTDRVLSILFLIVCASALGSGCGAPDIPTPHPCSGDEQCSATARCSSGACIENAAPIAQFTWSGELVASADILLDGSASHDPDLGDVLSSYSWSVSSKDASCPMPDTKGTEKTTHVRFGCGGHYEVQLIVFDGKQQESAPVVHTLEVAERTGPSIVTAGADQTVEHGCSGSPLLCTTASEIQLEAALNTQAALSVRWSVQAPTGRTLDSSRRVRFLPDATSLSPKVQIETDGTAISGDWVFRVEALNGADVLGSDITRVSVGNRSPSIVGGPRGPFPHTYMAASQFFAVNGSFLAAIADPDGDPVVRRVTVHHTGDGTSVFQATDSETSIGLAILVPRSNPEWLIGGAGLERSVLVEATDVNGSSADPATYAVTVGNQPPVHAQGTPPVASHSFDAVALKYVSTPGLGLWSDPDGDPLDHEVILAAASDCPTSSLRSDGTVELSCERKWTSTGDLPAFIAPRSAEVRVWDPWASNTSTVPFQIGNRPPVVNATVTRPRESCFFGQGSTHCGSGGSGSPPPGNVYSALTVIVGVNTTDPDGDPLQVIPTTSGPETATGSSCTPGTICTMTVSTPKMDVCPSVPPSFGVPYISTDGAGSATGTVNIEPFCG